MKTEFNLFEAAKRSCHGISLDESECIERLRGAVKSNLIDWEETQHTLDKLRALQAETGFVANDEIALPCGHIPRVCPKGSQHHPRIIIPVFRSVSC